MSRPGRTSATRPPTCCPPSRCSCRRCSGCRRSPPTTRGASPPWSQLARAREARKDGKRSAAEIARLQRALDEARAALAEAEAESARVRAVCAERCPTCGCDAPADDRAVRVVDAAVSALLARPPAGLEPAYIATFARRHRARLVGLVRARLGGSP